MKLTIGIFVTHQSLLCLTLTNYDATNARSSIGNEPPGTPDPDCCRSGAASEVPSRRSNAPRDTSEKYTYP